MKLGFFILILISGSSLAWADPDKADFLFGGQRGRLGVLHVRMGRTAGSIRVGYVGYTWGGQRPGGGDVLSSQGRNYIAINQGISAVYDRLKVVLELPGQGRSPSLNVRPATLRVLQDLVLTGMRLIATRTDDDQIDVKIEQQRFSGPVYGDGRREAISDAQLAAIPKYQATAATLAEAIEKALKTLTRKVFAREAAVRIQQAGTCGTAHVQALVEAVDLFGHDSVLKVIGREQRSIHECTDADKRFIARAIAVQVSRHLRQVANEQKETTVFAERPLRP